MTAWIKTGSLSISWASIIGKGVMFEELIDAYFGGSISIGILFMVFTLSAFSLFLSLIRLRLLEIEFVRFLRKKHPDVLKKYQQRRTWLKINFFLKENDTIGDDKHLLRIKRKAEQLDLIGKMSAILLAVVFTMMIVSAIMPKSA